jgi:outer membrane receptor protein involved in Fe transport
MAAGVPVANHPQQNPSANILPVLMKKLPASLFRPALLAVLFLGSTYAAEPNPAEKPKAPPAKQERIEVQSTAQPDRLSSTDSRQIVTRQDLLKFGDATVAGALARVLGVTLATVPGQSAEVRVRGLGAGYTQITINGDPAPAGFSLEALSTAQVEQIEVIRSPRADTSQAIGGVINIVLRKAPPTQQKDTRELRLNVRSTDGKVVGGGSGQYAARREQFAYGLTASVDVADTINRWIDLTDEARNNVPQFARISDGLQQNKLQTFSLVPRASWDLSKTTKLQFDGLAQHQQRRFTALETRQVVFGVPPLYPISSLYLDASTNDLRATLGANHVAASGALWEIKLVANVLDTRSDGWVNGFTTDRRLLLDRVLSAKLRDTSVTSSGRVAFELGANHTFASGWSLQSTHRDEDRIQRERIFITPTPDNLDEGYVADISRLSLFAQDEWKMSARLSGYVGVRWEQLKTDTVSTGDIAPDTLAKVVQTTSHISPTAQLLWKLPGSENHLAKLSLGRAYKAPTPRELIPRRYVTNDNNPTLPNFQGNPSLRPELSWNVDASIESKLPEQQSQALTFYYRRINDIILPLVSQDGLSRWIEQPVNLGSADMMGLEAQARYRLQAWDKSLPNIDLRPSLTLNRSKLSAIDGPNNRINQQPKLVMSLATDYRVKAMPIAMGANFRLEQVGLTRSAPNQSYQLNTRQFLDTYVLYGPVKGVTVRLTGQNLLVPKHNLIRRYYDSNITQTKTQSALTQRTFRVEVSMPL